MTGINQNCAKQTGMSDQPVYKQHKHLTMGPVGAQCASDRVDLRLLL